MNDQQETQVASQGRIRTVREVVHDMAGLITALAGLVAAITSMIVALTAHR